VHDSAIEGYVISPEKSFMICTCGRENATSGPEGTFEIYDGTTAVGKVYWNCPYGSSTNDFQYTAYTDTYLTQHTGGNLHGGALGDVVLKTGRFG
jgi:hypothetical protein